MVENVSSSLLPQLQDLTLLRLSWWIKWLSDKFPHGSHDILQNPLCIQWTARHFAAPLLAHTSSSTDPPPPNFLKWNVDALLNLSTFNHP